MPWPVCGDWVPERKEGPVLFSRKISGIQRQIVPV